MSSWQPPLPAAGAGSPAPQIELNYCHMLNSSVCSASMALSKAAGGFLLVVYNPLSWEYEWGVIVPVEPGGYTLSGPDGEDVPCQLLPVSEAHRLAWQQGSGALPAEAPRPSVLLAAVVKAPPLGHAVYKVVARARDAGSGGSASSVVTPLDAKQPAQLVSNGKVALHVDAPAGGVTSVLMEADGKRHAFKPELVVYTQNMGGGGAYVSTASQPDATPAPNVTVVKGPVVQEVRQVYANLGVLVTRLWRGSARLEVHWAAGPPPAGADWDVFVRYTTGIASAGVWFTDANGREFQQRKRDYRPAFMLVAAGGLPSNIYPVTSGCRIEDAATRMSVAVDRPQVGVLSHWYLITSTQIPHKLCTVTVITPQLRALMPTRRAPRPWPTASCKSTSTAPAPATTGRA